MLRKINGISPRELIIDLYLSTHCNFKCHYCYLQHYDIPPCSMTKLGIDSVMHALATAKHPVNLCVLGGEPTMAHLFEYTIDSALDIKNIRTIDVFTNGSRRLVPIDGVRYIISVHPEFFHESFINNFKHIANKEVKVMYDPPHLDRAKELTDTLLDAGIDVIPDYIHYHNEFDIGPKVHVAEDRAGYQFNDRAVSFRDIVEQDLWDARNFKCFQNEISVAPNLEIQQFCNPYKTHDPSYIANFEIKLMPCRFKRKCACFEQVKL